MTSLQTNTTAITRSRSTRAPANPHRTIQTRATTAATASAGYAATSSLTSQVPTAVTNVSLFLTNLHLLDLDLHPHWPGINSLTFTAKDATHGQKKRIQCVEWSLYHLFALWDPEEARNKLQPFFPPLDQVQSLNLRASLLRGLEHAKKNGVLGRDAVIRKTMLDECKGERLEEVLAVFSSAVLKKLVAEQQLNEPGYPALAQTLALEHRGYSGERSELNALVLVHRAALSRLLQGKNAARARFRDFSEVLDLKERSLVRRREQAKALEARERTGRKGSITDDAKMEVWRTVRNNWSGNEQWMETLLYGDSNSKQDGLLTTPFERVWRKVQSGRLSELEDQSGGLLEQLDRRVNAQRERLRRWEEFQSKTFRKTTSEPAHKSAESTKKQRGIDLGFGSHANLHLGRSSPRKAALGKSRNITGEYAELVDGLATELAGLDRGNASSNLPRVRHGDKDIERVREASAEETISELSELEDEPPIATADISKSARSVDSAPKFEQPVTRQTKTFEPSKFKIVETQTAVHRRQQSSSRHTQSVTSPEILPPNPRVTRDAVRPTTPHSRSPTRRTPSPRKNSSPRHIDTSPERPVSPTQLMADQILASMSVASPSPLKKQRHTLSLAERTRLSMVRRGSQAPNVDDQDGDDEPELGMLPPRTPTVTIHGPKPSLPGDAPEDDEPEYEDLVARTRRSMAGFEVARQKAQLERRRSQRKSKQLTVSSNRRDGSSYFPSLDEEGDSTLLLAEELMNNDRDDPDAIFKSRPKIKTSPVGTPVKGWRD